MSLYLLIFLSEFVLALIFDRFIHLLLEQMYVHGFCICGNLLQAGLQLTSTLCDEAGLFGSDLWNLTAFWFDLVSPDLSY